MSTSELQEPAPETPLEQALERTEQEYRRFWLVIGAGWLLTNVAYSITNLPMRFVLMDQFKLSAAGVAWFLFVTQFTNYIKPLAGFLSDAIPFLGTHRRHYLLVGLTACGAMWLILGVVPRSYYWWLFTYGFLHIFIVLISTVLGGVMSEGGHRYHASGRLSAQRIGIFRLAVLFESAGGLLARFDFLVSSVITSVLHFVLVPLFRRELKEESNPQPDFTAWKETKRQANALYQSRTLWCAAGLVFLVIAAPGFTTPLLFYQRETLHFSMEFIGLLRLISGACGVLGAFAFSRLCGRYNLRPLLTMGIITHVVAALLYLGYRDRMSALVISGLYEAAQTLALLPLYDLAIRATPRGSEALGYSVMMSVWNLTNGLSDLLGAKLFGVGGVGFTGLIFLNAGTTALVLIAIPFLPRALTDRKDRQAAAPPVGVES